MTADRGSQTAGGGVSDRQKEDPGSLTADLLKLMELQDLDVPLRTDGEGGVRVGKTNVLFDLVVRSYLQGHTPEEIVRQYTTLNLADVYGAIAYFHQHRDQVEEYLQSRDDEAVRVRAELEQAGIAVNVREFIGGAERRQADGPSSDG